MEPISRLDMQFHPPVREEVDDIFCGKQKLPQLIKAMFYNFKTDLTGIHLHLSTKVM